MISFNFTLGGIWVEDQDFRICIFIKKIYNLTLWVDILLKTTPSNYLLNVYFKFILSSWCCIWYSEIRNRYCCHVSNEA